MPRIFLTIACILVAGGACLAVAGCSTFAGAGPSARDVVNEAGEEATSRYELVDIDSSVVETLRHRGPNSFLAHFGDYRPAVEPSIGIGDTVSVTIWEAGAGGLFSASLVTGQFSTGSKSATIPDQVVGRDGAITVPYAGRIQVAGRTTRAVQTILEQALQGKAIQPQVLVNVTHSVSNTVTVTGEVANGARVPLSVKGDRVMDVIAAAGGIRAQVNETYVQLSRGDVTERVAMTRVTLRPKRKYLHACERRIDFDPGSANFYCLRRDGQATPKSLSMPKVSTCRKPWPRQAGLSMPSQIRRVSSFSAMSRKMSRAR